MSKKRIAVAMSGGVDSSVAAYILKEEGHDVFGITMAQIPDYVPDSEKRSREIVEDARAVADRLGIEHYVLDLREEFQRQVIDYFTSEYKAGRTPNPCVVCNRKIKFGSLFDYAKELGAEQIVTGHYAKIDYSKELGRHVLRKADDGMKDQTYFLYSIRQENLKDIIMPLEGYTKDQVREIAREIGLEISEKPDSEEICFITDDNHPRFIREDLGEVVEKGNFVDGDGNVLGSHEGIINYTVGQRRGLGISLGKRTYVKDIDPSKNTVVLGDEEDLYRKSLYAKNMNYLAIDGLESEMEVMAKIRYRAQEAKAVISPYRDGVLVEFEEAQRAITKGQSVVFYQGDIVLAGGIVEEVY